MEAESKKERRTWKGCLWLSVGQASPNQSGRAWVETRSSAHSSTGRGWAEAVREEQKRELERGQEEKPVWLENDSGGADHCRICCYRLPIANVDIAFHDEAAQNPTDGEDILEITATSKGWISLLPSLGSNISIYDRAPSTLLSKGERDQKATVESLSNHGTIISTT